MILDNLLKHILEFFYHITGSYGSSIILLSFSVSLFLIPVYWLIGKAQQKDNSKKALMQVALDKIKNIQNKQEKYYYTKEIYKKYNYSPYQSLIGLLGLFIQIPFFLAAFVMLQEYDAISNISYGPISNLALPDGLIEIRGVFINILPFIMTAVNVLAIKTMKSNNSLKEKGQLIVIALIFLALLYQSSAALVIYWTCNNIFSLVKNLLDRNTNTQAETTDFKTNSVVHFLISNIKRYPREAYTTLTLWAVYFLFLNQFLEHQLGECFSSIVSALLTIIFLDLIIFSTFLKALRRKSYIIMITVILIGLSHGIILYARFSTLTAYEFFKFVIGFQIIYLLIYFIIHYKSLKLSKPQKWIIKPSDLLITLILMFPLINYLISNFSHFHTLHAWLSYFGFFITIPIIVYFIIGISGKLFIPKRYTFISTTAILFTYYSVPYLTAYFKITSETNLIHHFLLLISTTILFIFLYYRKEKVFQFVSVILCCIAIISGIITLHSDTKDSSSVISNTTDVYKHLKNKDMVYQPDIYLLIYDAYVNEKQMEYYGIDNSQQMSYLEERQFTFYKDTYTLWMGSLGSMSRVLDMDQIKNESEKKHRERIANSTINKILQDKGYKTHYVLHPYFYTGTDSIYTDFLYPKIPSKNSIKPIIMSILIGEFKLAMELDEDQNSYKNTCIQKHQIFTSKSTQPKFLYAHSFYPSHSLLAGKCLPYERSRYEERLAIANKEMTEDINTILKQDNDAIIIVAGDHGAYLEGDCNYLENYKESNIYSTELADRFGMFLAIRYPNDNYKKYGQDIRLLQDVFFTVLSNLFEDKSLMNFRLNQSTYKVNDFIPEGAVKDGLINYGPDKGKPLYWDFDKQ